MIKFVASVLIIAVHLENGQCGAPGVIDLNLISIGGCEKAQCNCIETLLVEMPSDVKICSQASFIDGLNRKVNANYERIQKELSRDNCDCEFGTVVAALQKIYARIQKIINILSACNPKECMLNAAIDRYDELKKEYNSAIREATASQSSECGKILTKIRPILLNSAENIMAAVLKCLIRRIAVKETTK